jgi:nucleoside-diphosphate-sugar epimerase
MRTCLITGINGFTGSYIESAFKKNGYHVMGTVFGDKKHHNTTTRYNMDLQNQDEVEQVIQATCPDIVIHLAGISFIPSENPSLFYDVHIMGTRNLLTCLQKLDRTPSKIVLASSAQVYGTAANPDENTSPQPLNDYAVSKLAMEFMAKTWLPELPIVIARPFNYIGIGQSPQFVIPKLVHAFKSKQPEIQMGRIDVERDFSDVRYIADCYLALAEEGIAGETYNLCSNRSYSLSHVMDELARLANNRPKIIPNSKFMRKNDPPLIKGNNKKLVHLLQADKAIDIQQTMQWIYANS